MHSYVVSQPIQKTKHTSSADTNPRLTSIFFLQLLISTAVYAVETNIDATDKQDIDHTVLAQSLPHQPPPSSPALIVDETLADSPVYIRVGFSRVRITAKAQLEQGGAGLTDPISQRSEENFLRLSVGKHWGPLWSFELAALLNTSKQQSFQIDSPVYGTLFATSLSSVFFNGYRHFPIKGTKITPYVGANLAHGRFTSTRLGEFAQALRYQTPRISPVWALGASAGVRMPLGQDWSLDADLSWLPAKLDVRTSSSLPFVAPIQARVKLQLSSFNLSIRRQF